MGREKTREVIPSFSSLVSVLYYSRQAKYVWNIRVRCVCNCSPPPPPKKKNDYLPPLTDYPGYLWALEIAYISGAWFDLTGCKGFRAGNASDKWHVCTRIEANDLLLRVFLVFLPKACNLFATIPLNLFFFFSCHAQGPRKPSWTRLFCTEMKWWRKSCIC